MKIGLTLPQFGPTATRENVIQVAKMAEDEHFDSLWVGERLLWPLRPQTPYPGAPDGSLPTIYQNVLDPIEILTFAAANTEKIALGTCVIDMLFHSPVVLARRLATLDIFSQGRTRCGLGIGWSKDEYQVSNVPFKYKGARADEFVQALKMIWSDDVVEFEGTYYNIPASKIGPKPIQKPHIPILLGGFSHKTFLRIAKYAEGWVGAAGGPLEYLRKSIETLREQISKADRDPNKVEIVILTFPQIETDSTRREESAKLPLTGTINEIGEDLLRMKEMDVDHVIFAFTGVEVGRMRDMARGLSEFVK
jgi:probable F420-dependent oxidoreductase